MIPSFICSAVRVDDPSKVVSFDLTPALANLDHRRASVLISRMKAREAIFVQDLSASIPEDWREHFWASNVRMPDLYDRASEFLVAIGELTGLRSWQALALARQDAQLTVASAKKLQSAVSTARFVSLSKCTAAMLYDDLADAYGDSDTIIDRAFSHEDLIAAVGHTEWEGTETDRSEHMMRSNAWVRANARPFAFSTKPLMWDGVSHDDLRSILEDEPDLSEGQFIERVWTGIETDLDDNHYEDAHEAIRRSDDLTIALKAWYAVRRLSTSEAEVAFAAIRAWNNAQQITSHFPDMKTVVGLFDDVDHQEARDWVDRYVARVERELDALHGFWRSTFVDPEKAIDDARSTGFSLVCEPRHSSRQNWRWINDATGETSAKFLTLELCVESLPAPRPKTGKAT
jgi:hypothetical protein